MATRRVVPVSRKPAARSPSKGGAAREGEIPDALDVEIVWRYGFPRRHHDGFTGPARPSAALMGSTSTRGSMMPTEERSTAVTTPVLDGPQWRALLEARWQARLEELTELSLAYHAGAEAIVDGG